MRFSNKKRKRLLDSDNNKTLNNDSTKRSFFFKSPINAEAILNKTAITRNYSPSLSYQQAIEKKRLNDIY